MFVAILEWLEISFVFRVENRVAVPLVSRRIELPELALASMHPTTHYLAWKYQINVDIPFKIQLKCWPQALSCCEPFALMITFVCCQQPQCNRSLGIDFIECPCKCRWVLCSSLEISVLPSSSQHSKNFFPLFTYAAYAFVVLDDLYHSSVVSRLWFSKTEMEGVGGEFLREDEVTTGRRGRGVLTGRETIVVFGDLLGVLPCGRRARVIVE